MSSALSIHNYMDQTEEQNEFYDVVGTESFESIVDAAMIIVRKQMPELTDDEAALVKDWVMLIGPICY